MNALLAALDRGRTRPRRRLSAVAAALTVMLLSASGWRLAHGNRFVCAVPRDRLATAWSTDLRDPRRESIHRAFAASGRATAEASWQRVSKILDDYVSAWGAMYIQTCEATHVRGEQSAEVLDLRMSCLSDNLDQVRALTDALVTTDTAAVAHAVSAAKDLTPTSRCADVALLKSAVPLPKDEKTFREVQAMKSSLRDLHALQDVGNYHQLLEQANALRPRVEALGYKPLIAELLVLLGYARVSTDADASDAEATFRQALVIAEASRDDVDAATAASGLTYVIGYRLGRTKEAEFTSQLAIAFLDRLGPGNDRIRSWVIGDLGVVRALNGDIDGAKALAEQSLALKLKALGPEHPDVAIGYSQLGSALAERDEPGAALDSANKALDIFTKHGDPDGFAVAQTLANQGDALNALGRYAEAETAFKSSIHIFQQQQSNSAHPESAYAFRGLGEAKISEKEPSEAIPLLDTSLRICDPGRCTPILVADIKFALARALWDSGGNRARARALAKLAVEGYEGSKRSKRQRSVEDWLAAHSLR